MTLHVHRTLHVFTASCAQIFSHSDSRDLVAHDTKVMFTLFSVDSLSHYCTFALHVCFFLLVSLLVVPPVHLFVMLSRLLNYFKPGQIV